MTFDGLQFVRGSLRGTRVHLQVRGDGWVFAPALCSTAPGFTGRGWECLDRQGFPTAFLCAKCVKMAEARAARADKLSSQSLHALREECVRQGQLAPRSKNRTAAVREADAEARWNQRRLSGHTSR